MNHDLRFKTKHPNKHLLKQWISLLDEQTYILVKQLCHSLLLSFVPQHQVSDDAKGAINDLYIMMAGSFQLVIKLHMNSFFFEIDRLMVTD